jgi:DNA integrity scanning protein DisA with diadenylate cyclase activity
LEAVSTLLIRHARSLAREIGARAIVVYADALGKDGRLETPSEGDCPTILVTRSDRAPESELRPPGKWISVPGVRMTRAGQIKAAILICLARGLFERSDRVICLTGVEGSHALDALVVLNLAAEPELFSLMNADVLPQDVAPEVFERTLTLASQLAAEGREGRPVGTVFVLGDSERVLDQSRPLVLNPFKGYPESERNLLDPELEETIKEFSALDGAFVVRGDGVVLTAGTQLAAALPQGRLPGGLGTRHAAAAGTTACSDSIALCISQSTGTVSVFRSGRLITHIHRSVDDGLFEN